MTDISQIQGVTKKIGLEDIYFGDATGTPTFSCPTYSGSTITLNKVPPLFQNVVYPEQYTGAYGDGSTDDTAAVQAAHDALPDEGGTIVLTGRNWCFNLEVTKPNIQIRGSGYRSNTWWERTKIQAYDVDKPIIKICSITHETYGVKPNTGFCLDGVDLCGDNGGKYGIHLQSGEYCNFNNIKLENFRSYALKIGDSGNAAAEWVHYCNFVNLDIFCYRTSGVVYGILVERGSSNVTSTNIVNFSVSGPWSGNTAGSYAIYNGSEINYVNGWMEVYDQMGLFNNGSGRYQLTNVYVEGSSATAEVLSTDTHDSIFDMVRGVNFGFAGKFVDVNAVSHDLNTNAISSVQFTPWFYSPMVAGVLHLIYGVDGDEATQMASANSVYLRRMAGNMMEIHAAEGFSVTTNSDSAEAMDVVNTGTSPILKARNRGCPAIFVCEDYAYLNATYDCLRLHRNPAANSQTALDGIGMALTFYCDDDQASSEAVGRVEVVVDDVSHGSLDSSMKLLVKEGNNSKYPIVITGNKLGFYHNTTPVAQQTLATGAGATVDNVITALQNLGLVKQS